MMRQNGLTYLGASLLIVSLTAWVVFAFSRLQELRAHEEQSTAELAHVVDAVGQQRSLLKDVVLLSELAASSGLDDDRGRLAGAMALQQSNLEILGQRITVLGKPDLAVRFDAIRRAVTATHALAAAEVEGRDFRRLLGASADVVAGIGDLNQALGVAAQAASRSRHAEQSRLELITLVVFSVAIWFGLVPMIVVLFLRNRRLVEARRLQDEAARAAEEAGIRLRLATQGAGLGLWDWNPVTDRAWFSDSWLAMLGYRRGEIDETGKGWAALVHPADYERTQVAFGDHAAGRAHEYRAEARLRHADGSWKWVQTIGQIIERTESGEPVRVAGVHVDIDRERAAELSLAESEARFRSLTEMSSDWFWEQDADLRFILFSDGLVGRWAPGGGPIGKRRWDLPVIPSNFTWEQHRADLEARRPFRGLEYRCELPSGIRWFRVSGDPVFDPDGSFRGYRGVGTEISESKLAVDRIIQAREDAELKATQLSLTLAHMTQGLALFDAGGRLQLWNDRYVQLLDLDPKAIRAGAAFEEVCRLAVAAGTLDDAAPSRVPQLTTSMSGGETLRRTQRLPDGRVIVTISAPVPAGGWVTTCEDVTEREHVAAKVQHAAYHDMVTGLANRSFLKGQLDSALDPDLDGGPFSVMLIDLDRFKSVNDTFGHATGDKLLAEVAARMKAIVREEDVVARLGGDEFAIFYRSGRDLRDASIAIAARVLMAIASPYDIGGRQISIGASIGIAIAPEHGTAADELLRNADTALYRAKSDGRNRYRLFDADLDRMARERRELERDLRAALAQDQFEVYYQPVVSLADESVVGVEALLRWNHPVRGLVHPDMFVPILEEIGLIVDVGNWVLRQACRDAAGMPPEIRMAVNVSPVQLRHGSMLDTVTEALTDSGLDPRRLEIEVTESVLLEESHDLLSDLQGVKSLGVMIALDDFGTGYSSLSYLRRFPFDKIKIDKSFVHDFCEREDCAAIVCSVLALARSLNMVCIAEGVEERIQADLLRAAGCDLGQGWLFGRAVPRADLVFDKAPSRDVQLVA